VTTKSESQSPSAVAGGKPQQARDEATKVGRDAAQTAGQLAQQSADQGKQVVSETGRQARNLVEQAADQLREQAGTQQHRAAAGLRALSNQLQSMASKSDQDGVATDMVRRASDAAQQAAGWLEEREPGALVDEVRNYARHHPGNFLAGAALAGALVGRLTRGLAAGGDAGQQTDQGGAGQSAQSGGSANPPVVGAPMSDGDGHAPGVGA
jgi:hypothetical protein